MPLESGGSSEVIKHNIEILRKEGYSIKQAAAIAYRKAGKHKDYKKKHQDGNSGS